MTAWHRHQLPAWLFIAHFSLAGAAEHAGQTAAGFTAIVYSAVIAAKYARGPLTLSVRRFRPAGLLPPILRILLRMLPTIFRSNLGGVYY